jgi:prepilin-type N-terminal cleavage/methylation domain-containing protein
MFWNYQKNRESRYTVFLTWQKGFTLLELMLAVTILALVTTVTYMVFSTTTTAWKKGMALSDVLHHGDFVIEQLVMGLRSAYCPEVRGGSVQYGFWTKDNGEGEYATDSICWVKVGSALVGGDCPFVGSPHRVQFSIEQDENGKKGVAIRAWRLQGQTAGKDDELFEADKIKPTFLPSKIIGFNCRTAWQKVNDQIDWEDEWKETNRIPTVVELTFYLEPLQEGETPVELKRAVGIPVAPLSWQ